MEFTTSGQQEKKLGRQVWTKKWEAQPVGESSVVVCATDAPLIGAKKGGGQFALTAPFLPAFELTRQA